MNGRAVSRLARGRLYAILDLGYVEPGRADEVAGELIRGGADLIQLRGKAQSKAELASLAEKLTAARAPRAFP